MFKRNSFYFRLDVLMKCIEHTCTKTFSKCRCEEGKLDHVRLVHYDRRRQRPLLSVSIFSHVRLLGSKPFHRPVPVRLLGDKPSQCFCMLFYQQEFASVFSRVRLSTCAFARRQAFPPASTRVRRSASVFQCLSFSVIRLTR